MTEETDAALMRAGAQIESLRQQLQAARDRAEEVQAQMEDVVREVLCRAFPDGTELIPAFHEWYVPSQWLWWGRALGAFIGTEAAKRQAEVWEEAAGDDLVERVAEAIHQSVALFTPSPWKDAHPAIRDLYLERARAVLAVIQRAPTPTDRRQTKHEAEALTPTEGQRQ